MTGSTVQQHRRRMRRAIVITVALLVAMIPVAAAFGQTPPRDEPALEHTCYDAPGASFPDMASSDQMWQHGTAIDCLTAYGLTQGTSSGSYVPHGSVSRSQMAIFLARMARLADDQLDEVSLPDDPTTTFTDIDWLSDEAQDAIALLNELGVAQGVTSTTFKPVLNVTRGQMASFINRLQGAIQFQLGDDPDALGFTASDDFFVDDGTSVHEDNIDGIASVGITKGQAAQSYRPYDPVTRAQMASFLVRYLGVNVDSELLASTFPEPDDPTDPETISDDFVNAVADGDLDAAGALSTPRVINEVSDIGEITGIALFEFFPATPDSATLFEYGGGVFAVVFDVDDGPSVYLDCRTEAGLVRTCQPPAA